MMKQKLTELNKEALQDVILKMAEFLTAEQYHQLEVIIGNYTSEKAVPKQPKFVRRMSPAFVDEKMNTLKEWMRQIDQSELYLDVDYYEDFFSESWNEKIEYKDNQGIGEKITFIIQFAKECIDDCRYEQAYLLYEWLWDMLVSTGDGDDESVDLEQLNEEHIIQADLNKIALLTLYACYQVYKSKQRAEEIYAYFSLSSFQHLHLEDMFYVGKENLQETEQFWKDWISLLKTKTGNTESRLLQEAVLYNFGLEGLIKCADENSECHPSLYLGVMAEYNKRHDLINIEKTGIRAMENINDNSKIRSKIVLKAAYASSCLGHSSEMMRFCWEGFRSDTNVRNFLRLFGTQEMAQRYGVRGNEVLLATDKATHLFDKVFVRILSQNLINQNEYNALCFYTGDFKQTKKASKNPPNSLGWSNSFIRYGIRLFLLYLYENPLPSKAAASMEKYVGFPEETDMNELLFFENDILLESRTNKTSLFWTYFQKWKPYFPMSEEEKQDYLKWAETIVHSRADAIVKGQHRRQYGEVAALLAMIAEIKEGMGIQNAREKIYLEYKRKYPRHSAFQSEMTYYFDMKKKR